MCECSVAMNSHTASCCSVSLLERPSLRAGSMGSSDHDFTWIGSGCGTLEQVGGANQYIKQLGFIFVLFLTESPKRHMCLSCMCEWLMQYSVNGINLCFLHIKLLN